MTARDSWARAPRTLLEELIWQRQHTLEEFANNAEIFAREHGEPGTLSVRHLKRLVAGRTTNGISRPRPATARLLERIFDASIEDLLAPPTAPATDDSGESELRDRLRAAAQVDANMLTLLQEQLAGIRRLDRQLGAHVAHEEVLAKTNQVTQLLNHSLAPTHRLHLAAALAEFCTLAGWQALDSGNLAAAWRHYERAKAAAAESGNPAFLARAAGEQAFVLLDLGETAHAVELIDSASSQAAKSATTLLQAWLASAHGEALAANGDHVECKRAFDHAESLLPSEQPADDRPYVGLDPTHLARWRGHALALTGDPAAIDSLTTALHRLDATYTRAATALHVDLASALTTAGKHDQAAIHVGHATTLAAEVGSVRQQARLHTLKIANTGVDTHQVRNHCGSCQAF